MKAQPATAPVAGTDNFSDKPEEHTKMELYHPLIDTDSLGARIFSAADAAMPRTLDDPQRDARHQAVDDAVRPILETELNQLMERVRQTALHAADPDSHPAPRIPLPEEDPGPFAALGYRRIILMTAQEIEEQNTGEPISVDSIRAKPEVFLEQMPSLAEALDRAMANNRVGERLYDDVLDLLLDTARDTAAGLTPEDRQTALRLIDQED